MRDKVLLHLLCRHSLLSTKQIQERVFAGLDLTTVMRRLRKLQAGGFVVRLGMLPCRTLAWGCSQLSNELFTGFTSSARTNLHTLYHDVQLTELRFLLEDLTRVDDWFDIRHIKRDALPPQFAADYGRQHYNLAKGDAELVPDALFTGFKNDKPFNCSLEMELSVKAPARYRKLLREYSYRRSLVLVLYVVANDKIRAAVESAADHNIREACRVFTVRWADLLKCRDNAILQNARDRSLTRLHEIFDCRTRRDVHQVDQPVGKVVGTPLKTAIAAQITN